MERAELVRASEVVTSGGLASAHRPPGAEAQAFATRAWAENTRRAYRAAWCRFRAWCDAHGEQLLPASEAAVADYLADLAKSGRKLGTLNVALSAIAHAHRLAELPSPTSGPRVQMVLKGIRNTVGVAARQKAPILTENLREIAGALPVDLGGLRDRALLLLTFSGAFRRSEVVALDVADLRFVEAGLEVAIRRSKTDQAGAGSVKIISFGTRPSSCPLRALRAWIDAARIADGPLFREVDRHGRVGTDRLRPRAVARVVKRAIEAIGGDPKEYGAHSLRSGMITTAIKNGVSMSRVMAQSGHRSVGVLVTYDRRVHLWDDPASAHLGL